MKRISLSALKLCALSALIVACGRSGLIRTEQDLLTALRRAGADLSETALMSEPAFGVPGHVHLINGAVVHVYEYEDEAQRREVSNGISEDGLEVGDALVRWPARANIWARERIIVVYPGTDGGVILLISGLIGDPITQHGPTQDEPYPPAITAAIDAVAETYGLDPREVGVVSYAYAIWPDSCLGFQAEEEACVEGPVEGWDVSLRFADLEFETHSDLLGRNLRWIIR